jgi:hypothetical protein
MEIRQYSFNNKVGFNDKVGFTDIGGELKIPESNENGNTMYQNL